MNNISGLVKQFETFSLEETPNEKTLKVSLEEQPLVSKGKHLPFDILERIGCFVDNDKLLPFATLSKEIMIHTRVILDNRGYYVSGLLEKKGYDIDQLPRLFRQSGALANVQHLSMSGSPDTLRGLGILDPELTDAKFSKIIQSCPNLRDLYVTNKEISVTKSRCIASLANLQRLTLNFSTISAEALRIIATSLTSLQRLELADCTTITARGFHCLATLTKLEELDLCNTHISNEGLRAVTSNAPLRKLNLRDCIYITPEAFLYLPALKHLQKLNLQGTNISDEGVEALASIKTLRKLTPKHLNQIDQATQTLQKRNPQLEIYTKGWIFVDRGE